MLDIQFIRDNSEKVKKATVGKGVDPSVVDIFLDLDQKRRDLIKKVDGLRVRKNEIAKLGQASDEGKKIKEELKDI
ncbi:MAG: hypothetical protein AAB840_00035 [Patescibacteria group bacterium]